MGHATWALLGLAQALATVLVLALVRVMAQELVLDTTELVLPVPMAAQAMTRRARTPNRL